MKVRVSPISKAAAVVILALGVLMLVAGLTTGIIESTVAGIAITVLGVVLYRGLYYFTARINRDLEGAT